MERSRQMHLCSAQYHKVVNKEHIKFIYKTLLQLLYNKLLDCAC